MSCKDLHAGSAVLSHSKNISSKSSMNPKSQCPDNVNDTELIQCESQTRLTNSWVDINEPVNKTVSDKAWTKDGFEVNKLATVVGQEKSSLLVADPLKLGYVVPEQKSIYTSPYKQNFDSAVVSEDASLVFVPNNDDIDTRNDDILVVDSPSSRLSSSLDLKSFSPFASIISYENYGVTNTSESFCDLVSDTCGVDSVLQSTPIQSMESLNYSFESQTFDDAVIFTAPKMTETGKSHPFYPAIQTFSNEHPEHFGEHDPNGGVGRPNTIIFNKGKQGQASQMNDSAESFSYSIIEGVSKPPPELGLPDLTKKKFFPSSASDVQSGVASSFGEATDASAVVRNKVMGLWNNVKYGWSVNLGTNFSKNTPIVLLGHVYRPSSGLLPDGSHVLNGYSHLSMTAFRDAFHSLTWFSYRTKLPPLIVDPSPAMASSAGDFEQRHSEMQGGGGVGSLSNMVDLTSDCGWGCTLRCTQMMLCHALHRHFLGDSESLRQDYTSLKGLWKYIMKNKY